jgi:hypothetical protein
MFSLLNVLRRPMLTHLPLLVENPSRSKANKKGNLKARRSRCGVCDKQFKDENALKHHERNSPKHKDPLLSRNDSSGSAPAARDEDSLVFGFLASAERVKGGVETTSQDKNIRSTEPTS